MNNPTQQVQIYQSEDGQLELKVAFDNETVWLTQAQMAELFGTQRPAITKHLANIFKAGELNEATTCSILERMAEHGQAYKIKSYNLDAIISVGYRVNSTRAAHFSGAGLVGGRKQARSKRADDSAGRAFCFVEGLGA